MILATARTRRRQATRLMGTHDRKSRQPRVYAPHALHADWLVARFGHTEVTIKPAAPRTIYRDTVPNDADGARVPAGVWPAFGYTVEVQGEMTCTVATLDAAKAMGEWRALNSESNKGRASGKLLYSLTPGRAAEVVAMLDADRAALIAAFPFSPDEEKTMIRSQADYPEIMAKARARDVERLCGFRSPFE